MQTLRMAILDNESRLEPSKAGDPIHVLDGIQTRGSRTEVKGSESSAIQASESSSLRCSILQFILA